MNAMIKINPELEQVQSIFADIDLHEMFMVVGDDAQQSVTGTVMGYHLDNAFGNHVAVRALTHGYQEFVIYLETFDTNRDDKTKFRDGSFNLATVISTLRNNYDMLRLHYRNMGEYMMILNGIMSITDGARHDMHEPDEQGIGAEIVSTGRQIDYRAFDNKDVTFSLYKEVADGPLTIKGPNAARMQINFTVQNLIMMMMAIKMEKK